jgi:transmembrane sensor
MSIRQFLIDRRYRAAARLFIASTPRPRSQVVDVSPSHGLIRDDRERDVALIASIWDLSSELKGDPSVDRLTDRAIQSRDRIVARTTMLSLVAVATSLVGVAVYVLFNASSDASYSTGIGEQKTIALADGSSLFLNTATMVQVEYRALRRTVWLQAGEATFSVAKSRVRPFNVITPLGSARAVGTRFDVFSRPTAMEVAILDGTVSVGSSGSGSLAARVLIHAGELATIKPGTAVSVGVADLAGIVEHRVQRLEYDNVPLSDVLAEFNRYSGTPIFAQTGSIAARKISGVFHVGDSAALAVSLEASLQLHAIDAGNAIVLVADPGAN